MIRPCFDTALHTWAKPLQRTLAFSFLGLSALATQAQTTLWSESFETDGNGTRYTATEFSDGFADFFTRTSGSNIAADYTVTGADGSFFFGAQDTDGDNPGLTTVTITFSPINISGYTSLSFSGLFAEDDASDGAQDWDADALVFVEAQIDGGGWTKILQFASQGATNTEPGLDADFNGVRDGAALTGAFASFSNSIAGTGSLLELRLQVVFLEAGDEDIAFDLLKVEGVETSGGCTDVTAPVAVCKPVVLYLGSNGLATLNPADLDGGSSDDCTASALLGFSASNTSFSCADITGAPSVATDLFISEYVEGTSLNKYIEIFNGTGSAVDLADYQIRFFANGATTANTTNPLSGTLAPGAVIVYKNSGATVFTGTATNATAINFNGNDAVGLYKVSTAAYVDVFGVIGENPGTQWLVGGNGTLDKTLRRKSTVTSGRTPAAGFPELATEWEQAAVNDVSGLGSHSFGTPGIPVTLTVTDESGKSSTCTAEVFVVDNLAPAVVCKSATVVLDANGQGSLTTAMLDGGTTDNCGSVTLSLDKSTFDCADAASIVKAGELFISEYVEGSGFTKYVELFNATGATVNLANYQFRLYSNGAASATSVQNLSGMLPNGGTVVLANPSAIAYTGQVITLSAVNFNGDDAVEIYNTATGKTVDIFGRIGNDPGTAWTAAGGYSTVDKTLRRKASVLAGVTVNPTGTGPAAFTTLDTEWDLFDNNDVSGLGNHMVSAQIGIPVTLTAVDAQGNSSSCTVQVSVVDNTAPTAICQNLNIQLDATGVATIAEDAVNNGSSDNCGIVSIDTDVTSFTTANIGANTVTLTVADASGNTSTCTATVNVFAAGPAVFGFVLYNAKTNQPLMMLTNGAKIDLTTLPTDDLAIEALPGTDPVGSMRLVLSGPVNRNQTENTAPYFSFGDNASSGDVFGRDFKPGIYTFVATPYAQSGLKGMAGASQTITFELFIPQAEVLSLSLINPTTDVVVVNEMSNGEIVDLNALGGSFNIRANVNAGVIKSVKMVITDAWGNVVADMTENNAPYSIFGNAGGDFNPGTLAPGMYTITATPYSGDFGSGMAGIALARDFVVVMASPVAPATGGLSSLDATQISLNLYPNPASFVLYADLSSFLGEKVQVKVMNELGQTVWQQEVNEAGNQPLQLNLAGDRYTEGVYLFHVSTEAGMQVTRRFVISRN